jgi:predicted dehydrogenase
MKALEPVRWGLLGASNFALKTSVPAMQGSSLVHIRAVASRDAGKARAAAAELGVAQSYGSYEELLQDPAIEAIYNPLPNHLHVEWTERAARAGKHVLCEKPIAISAAEAARLIDVQRETGRLIAEAFMIRSHPQWRLVRQWLREGRIGDVIAVQAAFCYFNRDPGNIRNHAEYGGGALYDIGCYAVNCSRYIFDREPLRAVALLERDPQFGTDRVASGMLDYGGAHLTFTCSTQAARHQRVNLLGTTGRIEIQIPFNAAATHACLLFLDDGRELDGSSAQVTVLPPADQYLLQAEAFSRAIREGGAVENSIEVAVGNMRVIDALFRSAERGSWQPV